MSNDTPIEKQKEMDEQPVLSITIGCATRLCSLEDDELVREEIENLWFSLDPDSYMRHARSSCSGAVAPAFKHLYAKYLSTKDEFQDVHAVQHAKMSKKEEAKIMRDAKAREFVSTMISYDRDEHSLNMMMINAETNDDEEKKEAKSRFFDGGNRVTRRVWSDLEMFTVRHGRLVRRRNAVYGVQHPFGKDQIERSFCDSFDGGEQDDDIYHIDGPPDVLSKAGNFSRWRVVYNPSHETHSGLSRQEAHFRMACTGILTREHRWGWSQSYFCEIAAHLCARICTVLSFIRRSHKAYTTAENGTMILQKFEEMFIENHRDACRAHFADLKTMEHDEVEALPFELRDRDNNFMPSSSPPSSSPSPSTDDHDHHDDNDNDPDFVFENEEEEEEEEERDDQQYFYNSDQSDDEESVIDEDPEYNRPRQKSNLTEEQMQIISHKPRKNQMIVIKALPGTGKTTTCVAFVKKRACELKRKVLYTMLNVKMIGHTSQHLEGIRGVKCATFYALARRFIWEKESGEADMADSVVLPSKYKPIEKDVNDTLQKFWLSEDDEIDRGKHLVIGKGRSSSETRVERIMQVAKQVWKKMLAKGEMKKYTHQAYLKKFCTHPRSVQHIESTYNCILVDEAQDLPPVFIKFLLKLRRASIYVVGDPHQQIYTFAGSKSVFSSVDPTHVFNLTRSFRFGPAVAKLGTDFILKQKSEDIRMKGNPAVSTEIKLLRDDDDNYSSSDAKRFETWINDTSKAGQEVCYIARKNTTLLEMMIYLIEKGREFHAVGQPVRDLVKMVIGDVGKTDGWTQEDFREEIHNMVERGMQDQSSSFQSMTFVQNHYTSAYKLEQFKDYLREAREGEEDDVVDHQLPRIVVCSAHQSKGMEFDHVILASDFEAPPGEEGEEGAAVSPKGKGHPKKKRDRGLEEVNILFVAMTRCIKSIWLNKELSDLWRLELKKQRNRAELKRCIKEENQNRKKKIKIELN